MTEGWIPKSALSLFELKSAFFFVIWNLAFNYRFLIVNCDWQNVSEGTVSKLQHYFILHLGDGRQRVWHRHGGTCWVTTGAMYVVPAQGACGGVGRILGDIFHMARHSWCWLTGHRMPQNTTQKSWPVTCCHNGTLWATRQLLTKFVGQELIQHPTQRDWLQLDWIRSRRQVRWVHGWLGSHGVQSWLRHTQLNKCDHKASLACQGPWL